MKLLRSLYSKPLKPNPIEIMLLKLGTNQVLVTNHYLEELIHLFAKHEIHFGTYKNVFKFLEFLDSENCVKLEKNSIGSYTLTGLHNYGK